MSTPGTPTRPSGLTVPWAPGASGTPGALEVPPGLGTIRGPQLWAAAERPRRALTSSRLASDTIRNWASLAKPAHPVYLFFCRTACYLQAKHNARKVRQEHAVAPVTWPLPLAAGDLLPKAYDLFIRHIHSEPNAPQQHQSNPNTTYPDTGAAPMLGAPSAAMSARALGLEPL